MDKKINISWDILVKKVGWGLTPEEESAFQEWLAQDKSHEVYFERVRKVWGAEEPTSSLKSNLSKVMTHFDAYVEKEKELRRRRIMRNVYWYAACLLVVLSVGGGMWFFSQHDEPVKMEPKVAQDILPGGNKAIILLADGEKVDVEWLADSSRYKVDGIEVTTGEGKIRYKGKNNTKVEYNTIMIPRGGEYQVELSDGTKVHLNSMSSLRFPVAFTTGKREVELQGEAYFEVSKTGQPFIVNANGMQVEVLGTTFNISAYPDEEYQTTLVNGSVKVSAEKGESLILKPSQQATIALGSNSIQVRTVDTSFYTSWVKGKINFKDQRLEDIMKTLSRWYDMNVVYENEKLKNIRFGCNLNRYEEITPFVKLLEKTEEVHVKIEGNTITFHN